MCTISSASCFSSLQTSGSFFYTTTKPALSSYTIVPVVLTSCFLILRAKFRNWAMLFDETLYSFNFSALIAVLEDILLDFVMTIMAFFQPQHRFLKQLMCQSTGYVEAKNSLEKIKIVHNLRSISLNIKNKIIL